MSGLRLAIRPEHGPEIGGGHLGRCLALAQAWKDRGGEVLLVADDPPAGWLRRWTDERALLMPTAPWPGADAYVLDGYSLGPAVQHSVPPGAPLLVFDDFGQVEVARADLVLDQNLGSRPGASWPDDVEPLLGPRYALIRREVRHHAEAERHPGRPPQHVLLSAGSSPPEAWWQILAAAVAASDTGLSSTRLAGVTDVGALLAASDIGLLAGGSTVWEALMVGLPCVVMAFADNQRPIARALGAAGAAIDGGDHGATPVAELASRLRMLVEDAGLRCRLAQAGPQLVDGAGAARVVEAILSRIPQDRGPRPRP